MDSKLSLLKLIIIQCCLTVLFAFSLGANASVDTELIENKINTFITDQDTVEVFKGLNLRDDDKLLNLKIKAQAQNSVEISKLAIFVNGKVVQEEVLGQQYKTIKVKARNLDLIEKVEVKADAAFIRLSTAEVEFNENLAPETEDFLAELSNEEFEALFVSAGY